MTCILLKYIIFQRHEPKRRIARHINVKIWQAADRYLPIKYSGRVVSFMSEEREDFPSNPSARIDPWRKYFTGSFDAHVVPGKHLDILKEPNVRILAQHLKFYLNKASQEENC